MPSASMSSASRSSVRELRERIAVYGTNELPEMIAIVREAEIACMVALGELNRQIRSEREQTAAQRGECDLSILIWGEAVERWNGRIAWLQNVRRYLEKEQRQHEDG